AFDGLCGQAAAGFGGDDDILLTLLPEAGDEALAAAHAVDVGGVDEVDAGVDGGVEGGHRVVVIDCAPCAADGPCAEADVRNLPGGTSELAVVHECCSRM